MADTFETFQGEVRNFFAEFQGSYQKLGSLANRALGDLVHESKDQKLAYLLTASQQVKAFKRLPKVLEELFDNVLLKCSFSKRTQEWSFKFSQGFCKQKLAELRQMGLEVLFQTAFTPKKRESVKRELTPQSYYESFIRLVAKAKKELSASDFSIFMENVSQYLGQ